MSDPITISTLLSSISSIVTSAVSWMTTAATAIAGNNIEKGSGTSSSLLWEIGRILEECKEKDCLPQILLAENVAACHSKKFLVQFNS